MLALWIDTDIGTDIDDAVAILCAARHPEIHLVGVSTVFRHVEARAWLARELLARAGIANVPILPGAVAPADGPAPTDITPPAQALNAPTTSSISPLDDDERIDALAQAITDVPAPFHLVTIGPLTNIVRLLDRGSEVSTQFLSVTCMAGKLNGGAEYNVKCDPKAAAIVFEGLHPRVIGIEACSNVLTRKEAEDILRGGDSASDLLLECYHRYRAHSRWHVDPETAPLTLFDPITLLSLVDESSFRFEDILVAVEQDGHMHVTEDGAHISYARKSDWGKLKPVITALLRGTTHGP